VPLVILLVALLVIVAAAGLFVWIRRAKSCGRTIGVPAGESDQRFYGGVMCRHLITSGMLVRLDFFDWGVRLRGIVLLSRWLVPTWEARYEELAIGKRVAMQHSRIAVWFKLRNAPDGIAFLSTSSEEILRLLERRGVPVNRSVAQIKRVEELYR
jgi:hypothetical protein